MGYYDYENGHAGLVVYVAPAWMSGSESMGLMIF